MKKQIVSYLLLCMIFALTSQAQTKDSLLVVHARWEKKRIAKGTHLFTYHFKDSSLFSANQYVSFLRVKNGNKRTEIVVGADPKVLHTTSDFAERSSAIGAINGTFFDIKNGGSVDYVRSGGNTINPNRLEKNGIRARHQQAAVVVEKGILSILKWDGTPGWETTLSAPEVMLSGPMLVSKGIYESLDSTSFTRARHPRSVVGTTPKGDVLLLTVDGRQSNSAGMTLPELSRLMKWLGAKEAINLDGGGSTTLWARGEVVNFPSDNKKWDHEGQRKVANVLLVRKKERVKN